MSSFDLWRVQLANGDVVLMSLDQLDDAFQAGTVHEHTHVLREGMTDWTSLGEAAGLTAEAHAAPVAAAPLAPSTFPPAAYVVDTPGPLSFRPVVSEISDFELGLAPRRSKKSAVFITLAAAMILGGAGFSASRVPSIRMRLAALASNSPAPIANVANVAAAVATPPSAPAQPPAVAVAAAPASPAAPAAPSAAAPSSTDASGRLSPEQIRALLEGDKTHAAAEEKAAAKKAEKHHRTHAQHASKHGKAVFQKGGSKFDPLNASL